MAGPRLAPFTNVDPATEADLRSRGLDTHEVDRSTEQLLTYICTELIPALPLSDADAAPTILNDAHLRPKGCSFPPTPADSPAIVTAISIILEAHTRAVICSVVMEDGDIDFVVAKSPILETLNIHGCNKGLRLRLVSQSLRCVQICSSVPEDIAVVKAPRLERLILEGFRGNAGGSCTRVRIGDAPKLHALGILQPGNTILEIRDNIVMAGINASPSAMATSVKFLSLNVRFGSHTDSKMVLSFLGCFPNLEALHIMSEKCDYEAGSARLNLNFWKLVKPTENVKSCIKVFSYKEFRGELGEVAFLKFFRSARALRTASVSMANPSFTSFSMDEATFKAQQASNKMASRSCEMVLLGSTGPEGGRPWSFKTGTDYSFEDPFSVVQIRHKA